MAGKQQYGENNIAIGHSILDNIIPIPCFTGTSIYIEENMADNDNIESIIIYKLH